ncbi:ABC transporter permease [soil metagenome]
MLQSYFKIAVRNLLKNKVYSFINIGGLAVGMTVAMLIGLWIYDELSFNRYHRNYDLIGQIWNGKTDLLTSNMEGSFGAQYPVATTLKEKYPHYFKHVLQAWWLGNNTLTFGEKKFIKFGQFIEGGAISMLSLKMIKGGDRSLDDPRSIILSESSAESIFGTAEPIGKILIINSGNHPKEVMVTGIYENIPSNDQFGKVEFFAPWSLIELSSPWWIKSSQNDWDHSNFNMYVQLNEGVDFETVNAAIADLYRKNVPEDYFKIIESSHPFVQVIPMSSWHLYSEFKDGKPVTGRIVFVWLFGIIGTFVLLLACINFINLSTARSEKRAKEVGVRKTIGSKRYQLIAQFLGESFLTVALAIFLSLGLLLLFQSAFNDLAGKEIHLPFGNSMFWIVVIMVLLITALVAGTYPAFYLSSFQPVTVLKGSAHTGRLSTLPRKTLVVLQFTVAVVLIIGTIVVNEQVQFAQDRPVGYNRAGLISLEMADPGYVGKTELLRNELMASDAVSDVSYSSTPLTESWGTRSGYDWEGKDPSIDVNFINCAITSEFGKTTGWKIVEGRDFLREHSDDSSKSIIINQSAAQYIGMKDPVGKQFINLDEFGRVKWSRTIIGVVENMIMESPYDPVRQTLYVQNQDALSLVHIRIAHEMSAAVAIPKIRTILKRLIPSAAFDYKFVDEEYAAKFRQEQRIGELSTVFSVIAIFISSLGLFGLASFVAERRAKEIGLRKIMGASIFSIWKMLSVDFVILVVVSFVVAIPIAYYLMSTWLQKFTYRTEISLWIFAIVLLGTALITLIAVSYQTLKAAVANPVNSLRSE